MSSQVTVVYEKRSRKRWAALGFLLIVALLVISWFIAPPVIDWLKGINREFRVGTRTMPYWQLQVAFTLAVFVILGAISALIVTLFAPRKPINVREKDLSKERLDDVKYQRVARKRQRTLNREMREYMQSKNDPPKTKK